MAGRKNHKFTFCPHIPHQSVVEWRKSFRQYYAAIGAQEDIMYIKRIYLEENNDKVWLDAYIADPVSGYTRSAILVIPGGGYGSVCSDREGEPIALGFMSHGYNAFVLQYSVARAKSYPAQLIQASLAMAHIRDNAVLYGIDPDKVFVTGFSAGGHLAGSLGTMWHKQCIYDATGMEYGKNRPNGMMLVYPVVTAMESYTHLGSFQNLWGTDTLTDEMLREVSLEANVDEKSVPLFLIHTSNDQVVDIRHALTLANAYKENGLMFEMHIYPDAPHGIALGNDITRCGNEKWSDPAFGKWIEHAVYWAEKFGG